MNFSDWKKIKKKRIEERIVSEEQIIFQQQIQLKSIWYIDQKTN